MVKKLIYKQSFFLFIALAAVSCTCVCSQDAQAVEDFFHVIEHGVFAEVERLVAINPGLIQARGGIDRDFETALHIAACVGKLDVVRFLCERGADVEARSQYQYTGLLCSAAAGHLAIVQTLVDDFHADTSARSTFGSTALHLAVDNARAEVVCYLLDKGVDCEVKNHKGESPLLSAVGIRKMTDQRFVRDYQTIFELLLRHGARVDTINNSNETPLHKAAHGGCVALVRFLVDYGAIIDAPDNVGKTPLFCAIPGGHLSIVEFLVARGADVDKCLDDGTTPIYSTLSFTRSEIFEFLVQEGADIHIINQKGATPFLAALLSKMNGFYVYYDMLRRVLEFGVPFTNAEEITKLREVQQHGFDADSIICKRRQEVEEILLGKPSRVPQRIQRGLRALVQRERIPRVFAGAIQWSVSRRDRIADIRDFPPGVLRIIVDYSVTPYLPILE